MKILFTLLMCFVLLIDGFSQSHTFYFRNFNERNGLADNNIGSIVQDSVGFLWCASSEGLNRFDGKNCKVYRHSVIDSTSLSHDNINVVFIDSKQRLWVGTRNGLNLYNAAEDNFITIKHVEADAQSISSNEIWSIAEDNAHYLWIGTMGGGLNKLIEENNGIKRERFSFQHFVHNEKDTSSVSDNFIWSIAFDNRGFGWLGTENGLNRFSVKDVEDNRIRFTHFFPGKHARSLANNSVWKIYADKNDNIWLLSLSSDGMFDCLANTEATKQPADAAFLHILPAIKKGSDQSTVLATSFLIDENNRGWLGTNNGLVTFNISVPSSKNYIDIGGIEYFASKENAAGSIAHNLIWRVYEDNNGLIWAGTANGLSVYNPKSKALHAFTSTNENTIGQQQIKTIAAAEKYVWLSTVNNEIWHYDIATGKYSLFFISGNDETITALLPLPDSSLLIAFGSMGLFVADIKKISNFLKNGIYIVPDKVGIAELQNGNITSLSVMNNSQILVTGLGRFGIADISTKTYTDLSGKKTANEAAEIFRCASFFNGKLYAGSDNGLYSADGNNAAIDTISKKISAQRVNCILANGDELWIGTISGLNVYNKSTGKLIQYFVKDGLTDDNILSLTKDKNGDIWAGTRNGLNCYKKTTGSFLKIFDNDGLNSNQVNFLTVFKDHLFIATDNGFNTVNTAGALQTNTPSGIYIKDFSIAGKTIFNTAFSANAAAFRAGKPIQIGWQQNNISIEFSVIDFVNPEAVSFAYMLEGFDEDWVFNGNQAKAAYTNLPGGNYIFKIKYAGSDGIWKTIALAIPVAVSTAWFKTWWFYLACCLFISALLYSYYRIRINRLIEMQQVRNKIAKDLHDDMGSTLSTINILSLTAIKKMDVNTEEAGRLLRKIGDNSRTMMESMGDIVWSINPLNDTVENMTIRMKEYAAQILEPKSIGMSFIVDENVMQTKIPLEKRRDIFLVFKEAVNNMAKYSSATLANIELCVVKKQFQLTVKDNGKGFDMQQSSNGNGLRNMKERTAFIGGVYVLEAAPGKGTVITLHIPVG